LPVVASLSSSITSAIGDHGLYAVFALMALGAVLPVGSELVMIYAGAIASGAFASQHVVVFGSHVVTPVWAYLAIVIAGVAGNTVGAAVGWAIGRFGGRPFLLRYGRYLHVSEARLDRAHGWLDRRGAAAVPLGFALPLVRSFVAIPAGIAEMPLWRFLPLAALGSAVFACALAGGGWALGASYQSFRDAFKYVDVLVVAAAVGLAVYLFVRWRRQRSTTIRPGATDSTR
jgi:membrane protein DedA with SNARE-associated domain